jgi:hypothetical protein
MAIELSTGYKRKHHDLDVVVMDEKNVARWEQYGTDNVTPGQYWADMKFNPKFLGDTSAEVEFEHKGRTYAVEMVSPIIIMAQKLSDAFGRNPRGKDVDDARAVIKAWETRWKGNARGIRLVHKAIEALPEAKQDDTEQRIVDLVPKVSPRKKR